LYILPSQKYSADLKYNIFVNKSWTSPQTFKIQSLFLGAFSLNQAAFIAQLAFEYAKWLTNKTIQCICFCKYNNHLFIYWFIISHYGQNKLFR